MTVAFDDVVRDVAFDDVAFDDVATVSWSHVARVPYIRRRGSHIINNINI
jgi:hypothetical protein